jgi:hypothetical protein
MLWSHEKGRVAGFFNRQSSVINPKGYDVNQLDKSEAVSVSRRDFCKKAIKRSSIAAAVGVAGYLAYRKPAVRSFFGATDVYAATTTAAGKFSLKGDSN